MDRALAQPIVGYALIVFGFLKIALSVAIVSLPVSLLDRQSFIVPDKTAAGIVLEVVLFLFGTYSLSHGLSILGHLHKRYDKLMHRLTTFVCLYGGLGVFLITFYGLVVFTNVPIGKDESKKPFYELVGIGGGLGFLTTMLAVLAWNAGHDYMWGKAFRFENDVGIFVSILIVFVSCIAWLLYKYFKNAKAPPLTANEAVSLVMIPFGGVS